MKKKILRVLAVLVVLIVALVVALPFVLEGKFATLLKNKVNQNIQANFDFESASLSLVKRFPNASVSLQNVTLVNQEPFEGDTLFAAKNIALELPLNALFKSAEDPIRIQQLLVEDALLHIKVDSTEQTNYDIAVPAEASAGSDNGMTSDSFSLALQHYSISNATVIYDDLASGLHLEVTEMYHSGTGDLSLQTSELQTKTDALVAIAMDDTQYLEANKIALDALIGIDLSNNRYSFKENRALINQLPLVFDGSVTVNETNQEVDISFATASSEFKNFLALIPEAYSGDIAEVQTSGNFVVEGAFQGIVDDTRIPEFHINVNSEKASFKYPELAKTVSDVFIDVKINNNTGNPEHTVIGINRLSFQIDEDAFNMNATIKALMGATNVNAHMDGRINLANLSKAYPIPGDYDLSGILSADVTTAFTMDAVEKHQYEKTQTTGKFQLTDFEYQSEELLHPVALEDVALNFTPSTVTLSNLEGQLGETDFKASGTVDNLLGYLFNGENVAGKFRLQSKVFAVNDFRVAEAEQAGQEEVATETSEKLRIPSFLDCSIDAKAATVLYDNLVLEDVSGQLQIKEQTVYLENVSSSIFDGTISLNGAVSTKEDIPRFDLALGLEAIEIGDSFKALDLFKVIAPVADALEGRLNTQIQLSGDLKDDFTPVLGTLSGDILAQLLSAQVATNKAPLLSALDNQVRFIDLQQLDLKDLQTALSFEGGKVVTQPFTLRYEDIAVNISGNHTFDRQVEYQAVFDVPAKYLGDEVNSLIAQIDDPGLAELTIPVTATIAGSYSSPKVSSDLTSGVKQVTAQLVEIQKQKLLDQGKNEAKALIGGLLGGDSTDSTASASKAGVAQAIGGLLGETPKDSTQTDSLTSESTVKKAAKGILGGLLGKKKKDTVQ